MLRAVREALHEIDIILFVAEPGGDAGRDNIIVESLKNIDKPVFLLINKIDSVRKPDILRIIDQYEGLFPFKEIIPVSALKQDGTDRILERIIEYLPAGPQYYPDDIVTDQVERFMAAEIIREKIMEKTTEEIPYSVAVEVQNWVEREDGIVSISANIYVEREGQKGIIIGKKAGS